MKQFSKLMLTAMVAMLVAVQLYGGDAEKKAKGKKKVKEAQSVTAKLLKGIDLTDEQKTQVAAIDKEFGPKAAELQKKEATIVSADQRKAAQTALKAARDAGKKGKELNEAREAALNLSEEQKAQYKELQAARGEFGKSLREAVAKILTDEQKAKLPGGKGKPKTKTKTKTKKKKTEA
ncbi:MAG: hypothetical protein O3A00_00640 [Planctomycetota bacterium]|nr:hypothetical protein [Planctomycetota bacterium]